MYPLVPISTSIQIPTYYLLISLTVCICLVWVVRRAQRRSLSRKVTMDLSLIIMISGFLGARLFHVFYEEWNYYREDLFRIAEFWNGGFVFYGGALLAGLTSLIYLKNSSKNAAAYLDLFAPVVSLSYILGRIACLLAGCCYGKFCELPWALEGRHPTQAYAALWEIGVLAILLGWEKSSSKNGAVFYLWMILHSMGRLLMELFRDDFRGPTWGLSISSWISLGLMFAGFYLLFRRPTNRGTTSSP